MFDRIVTAIDDTPYTDRVLEVTKRMAGTGSGTHVLVLHLEAAEVVYDTVVDHEDDREARRLVTRAVEQLRAVGVRADGEIHGSLRDDIADEILSHAHQLNADLIIMGRHHHTAFSELLLGSISHRVDRRSDISLLLVH
jgi:nucleotide-binding universal stress UspA family protein